MAQASCPEAVAWCVDHFTFLLELGFRQEAPPDKRCIAKHQARFSHGQVAVSVRLTERDWPSGVILEAQDGDGRGIPVGTAMHPRPRQVPSAPLDADELTVCYVEKLRTDYMDILPGNEAHFYSRLGRRTK